MIAPGDFESLIAAAKISPLPWLLFVIPLLFPLWWCAVMWLISRLSGWNRLAKYYQTIRAPEGKRWSWQQGMVGWCGYNGCLVIHANREGLFLEVFALFRIGHPPLFIPWPEMHQIKRTAILWQKQVRFEAGDPKIATIRLPAAVFEDYKGAMLPA